MSAVEGTRGRGRPYDAAARRVGVRRPNETGAWVYIPGVELEKAGFVKGEPPPFYRTVGHKRSRNAGSVIVSLYRER